MEEITSIGAEQEARTPQLWEMEDVKRYLRVSDVQIWRWCREMDLPYIKIGRKYLRFRPEAVKKWIVAHELPVAMH